MLGISRSEVASGIFIKACSEFIFLESVAVTTKPPVKPASAREKEEESPDLAELIVQIETILADQDEDMMYASELKDTLTRLRPDFDERNLRLRHLRQAHGHGRRPQRPDQGVDGGVLPQDRA